MSYCACPFRKRVSRVFLFLRYACVVSFWMWATASFSQDFVITPKGKLADRDFYRLVSCGAKPGGKCRIAPLRWSAGDSRSLTLRIVGIEEGFPKKQSRRLQAAITSAIAEINAVGSAVRMTQITSGTPDYEIRFMTSALETIIPDNRSIQGEILAGGAIAMVRYKRNGQRIRKAQIFLTDDIPRRWIRATVLEELVQGLGLPFDIHNKYYERRSMFSETDCCQPRLKGQDARAVYLHYPPG